MARVPVVPESCTHALAEGDALDGLLSALRLDSSRLKCSCVGVSRRWLALGTSAGGLHLIQRDGWKPRLILTHKEGAITRVACCPHDEDFVAVATSQGLVVVWELHWERRGRPERACVSWEHRGRSVSALCWDTAVLRVFAGDSAGRVSCLRIASPRLGKGAAFVMFPVQTITTVDSHVVQLGFLDGRLLVSSLSRCYLCDTERERFWRIGNKEREGEFGACFFPPGRGGGQAALVYCARPGSRFWEASFNGEVLSTQQFKQLLSTPALPLVSHRCEPQYSPAPGPPQSIAFPRLHFLSDQYLLSWTDSGIYIFVPHSAQLLLWTEVKDILDVAVFRNELYCLHGDGRVSQLCLLPVERCVERLLRREAWASAATLCCLFQHAIAPCRARKSLPIDRLEHLKAQLDGSTHRELIGQLEEVISRLEPFDSASSSRRSSISSHESFNVLDCGIYRVISRRGSQSDEETSSLVSQSLSEEERLREFSSVQEEEPAEQEPQPSDRVEADRSDATPPFLPLPFRPKPPRAALQAVRDSVSSFMKKTTEKITTLQMNSDLWPRPDLREGGSQGAEVTVTMTTYPEEQEDEGCVDSRPSTEMELQELKEATEYALSQIQDVLVLLDPACLGGVLGEWLPVLERVLGPDPADASDPLRPPPPATGGQGLPKQTEEEEEGEEDGTQSAEREGTRGRGGVNNITEEEEEDRVLEEEEGDRPGAKEGVREGERPGGRDTERGGGGSERQTDREADSAAPGSPPRPQRLPLEPVRACPPCTLPPLLDADLAQLASLCLELGHFPGHGTDDRDVTDTEPGSRAAGFLQRFFFLLDPERAHQACLLRYQNQPRVWASFLAGVRELTRSSPVVPVLEKGDLLRSLRHLRELKPWAAPPLLSHLHRLYERHGELALRSFGQFYPTIIPADVMAMAKRSHFLAYLDNLVQSQPEDQRPTLLASLLQPESLRHDWLELALSHDAPQQADTMTPDGLPRWRSHLFRWGYGRLLALLIQLPADLQAKQRMAESCRSHGFWQGYVRLCCELERRTEVFSTIVSLDDITLLDGPWDVTPETLDEWKLLLRLSRHHGEQPGSTHPPARCGNGHGLADGAPDWPSCVSPENVVLRLARAVGPDRALAALGESGEPAGQLSAQAALVCETLRVAETRQRAVIQAMLERCDRFLWSQQA
ncbi:BLOC-2 complex member HPS5 [Amia ocellicauda]|uniref:BLOC-2 complex member HPS5 n=1 Tax=Amia ocellicauda TaxID=2972642 RepID=UPI003464CB82